MLRALVAGAGEKGYRAGVIAVHASPHRAGPQVLDADGAPIRVVPCVSALAVREALIGRNPAAWLIVLTDRDNDDLGDGLLAHLVHQRVVQPDLWDAVRDRFQARRLDSLLVREGRWLAETLLAEAPPQGWPPARGGTLTRDGAYEALAARALDLPADRLDTLGLLEWTLDQVRVARLDRLSEETRKGLLAWLGGRTGATGCCTLTVVETGNGADAVPLALVAGLLADDQVNAVDQIRAAEARGRLAPRYGGHVPSGPTAHAWADAAHALIEQRMAAELPVGGLLARAELLLDTAGVADLAAESPVLPRGFDVRLQAFASAARSAAEPASAARPSGDVAAAEAAYLRLTEHLLADREVHRVGHAHMALRLLRWPALADAGQPETIAAAVDRHVADDGWVDRARADVWNGDDDPTVAAAYRVVYAAATARRATHDERFAALLAAHTAAGAAPGSLLHVEDVLRTVVLPLAREVPTLLLVVDAMSAGVASELADGIAEEGWVECLPTGDRSRRGVLAALPTVTEVNRTTLLRGAVGRGGQAEEVAGLAALVAPARLDAVLFHKADLEGSAAGELLPASVRDAVGDPDQRLVAVVLNTVDDALDRADPGRAAWDVDAISHLRPLLRQARIAGRALVLTSDHGHIVERRDGELHSYPGVSTARWRPGGPESPPAGEGEIAAAGRRVVLGGGRVVMAWRETLRYAPLRAGYHGGASPAEAVIPLTVHVLGPAPAGWEPAPPQAPPWWLGAPSLQEPPRAAPRPARQPRPRRPEPEGPTLFEVPGAAATEEQAAGGAAGDLAAAVVGSEIYAAQRERARRVPLDDAKVMAILRALLAAGGRLNGAALAAAAGIPEFRLPGIMSALQRRLNVEGYEVVGYDLDGVTVILDERLLREQFDLEGGQ